MKVTGPACAGVAGGFVAVASTVCLVNTELSTFVVSDQPSVGPSGVETAVKLGPPSIEIVTVLPGVDVPMKVTLGVS
jgi:hypothetical protein